MADPADLGAGGTQEYPNYADDEGKEYMPGMFCLHLASTNSFRMAHSFVHV